MAPHAPGELSANHRPTLIDLDRVLPTTETVLNYALHFQQITFTHARISISQLFARAGPWHRTGPSATEPVRPPHRSFGAAAAPKSNARPTAWIRRAPVTSRQKAPNS